MICRLCLNESDSNLKIYTEAGEMAESEIVKVVAKHFQIEIRFDDTVSNAICFICWGHLQEFHKFWLSIDEKQKTLSNHLQSTQIKRDIEEVEAEAIAFEEANTKHEIDNILSEPEVDVLSGAAGLCETLFVAAKIEQEDEFSSDNDASMEPLTDALEILSKDTDSDDVPLAKHKRKYTKKTQKATKTVAQINTRKKRGRPSLKDSVTKPQKPLSEQEKAERIRNIEEKKKTIIEAEKFLAENAELSCCICNEKLKTFKELKRHFKQIHQCMGYIMCCDIRFTKRTLYADHLQLHKNPDFFKCSICNKQLISRKNYMNHMHSLHPAEENLQYECQHCSRKFSKQYILDSHIKMRHLPKIHTCKICDKSFGNIWILSQHERSVHRNEFESVCEVCGKLLKNAANLQYHMDNIHNSQPRPEVECPVCHKWLKSERTLRKHMIRHRDEASGTIFKCSQCNAVKSTRHSLSSHIRYHHSDKVFPCTMCSKEFKTPIALKEHEATHTGVDLYTCPFCPKTFRSHANMHKHKIHSHSDEWVRKYAQPNQFTQSVLNQNQNQNPSNTEAWQSRPEESTRNEVNYTNA